MSEKRKAITDSQVLKELASIDQAIAIAKQRPNEPTFKVDAQRLVRTHRSAYQALADDSHQAPSLRDAAQVVLMELDDLLADIDSLATR